MLTNSPYNPKDKDYYLCNKSYRLTISGTDIVRLVSLGLRTYRNHINITKPHIAKKRWVRITKITQLDNLSDTYCFTEPLQHTAIFNGVLTRQCTEIFQNTYPQDYKVKVTYSDNTSTTHNENDIITLDNNTTKEANKLTPLDTLNQKTIRFVEKVKINGQEVAVCNLASINLSKTNTEQDIKEITRLAVRFLDNVLTLNYYPDIVSKETNERTRAIGLGVMGEAQFLAENKIYFGSQEHKETIDEIMEMISYHTINASADLSIERSPYPDFKHSKWSKGLLPIDNANDKQKSLTSRSPKMDWQSLRDKLKTTGIRNGYLMAIAPTSTISIMSGTTQTIEPIYKKKWFEENISGMIPVVVPNLNLDTYNYYTSAYEIPQERLIELASIRQKWIDQGQSLNLFIPISKASGKLLNELYTYAHKLNLKSTYYLRSESPTIDDNSVLDRTMECVGCQ